LFEEDFALVISTGYPEELVDTQTEEFRPEFLALIRRELEDATKLDAWIKLGSRLRQFVLQTTQKYGVTLLSEPLLSP
jgi:hypothetical protein